MDLVYVDGCQLNRHRWYFISSMSALFLQLSGTCKLDNYCTAQKDYCIGACKLDLDPNGCLMRCLCDRGCDFENTDLTCEDFGTFSAGPNNKCGTSGQGGSECESECCDVQKKYCDRVCVLLGCKSRCLEDRGCDPASNLSCEDFGTFSAGTNNKCGTSGQGGSKCKSECCDAQKKYCDSVCVLGGCKSRCLSDRGC